MSRVLQDIDHLLKTRLAGGVADITHGRRGAEVRGLLRLRVMAEMCQGTSR